MPQLAIILLDDYDADELRSGFRAAFEQLRLASSFRAGEKILIKPNLLSAVSPEKAATPHPAVFGALAEQLKFLGVRLTYGDSPATETPERAAQVTGMAAVAEAMDIPLADFNGKEDRPLPNGKVLKRLPLARGVAAADGVVSLAKLKTHALVGMTGVVKNLFGVIPGMRKATYHANFPEHELFCQMISDIAAAIRPRLSVLDGVIGMEGNGPRNGTPRRVGAVLLSIDPVAVDAAAAYLIGLPDRSVATTRLAAADGLGEIDLAKIDMCLIRPAKAKGGTPDRGDLLIQWGPAASLLPDLQVTDFVPAYRWQPAKTLVTAIGAPLIRQFILNRPVIDRRSCIRCGACAASCPLQPQAVILDGTDNPPMINYRRCIRCFCCQEICPAGAIDVRRTLIGKILRT